MFKIYMDGPTTKSTVTKAAATHMLTELRILIPFPSPDHPEIIKRTVATIRITNGNQKAFGALNEYVKPLLIWADTKPSVDDTPTIVAKIAKVSTITPGIPRMALSPNIGISVELTSPGASLWN